METWGRSPCQASPSAGVRAAAWGLAEAKPTQRRLRRFRHLRIVVTSRVPRRGDRFGFAGPVVADRFRRHRTHVGVRLGSESLRSERHGADPCELEHRRCSDLCLRVARALVEQGDDAPIGAEGERQVDERKRGELIPQLRHVLVKSGLHVLR